VFTHTRPWPPPGAGGLAAASALLFFAAAPVAAAGLAAAEFFGLNILPSENFAGDGAGLVAVSAFLRVPFALGAAAGDAAGLAVAPASAFLRPRLAGEEGGAAAGEDDAAASLGDAAVWAFVCARFLGAPAGDSPGVGDCACTPQALASPIAKTRVRNLLVMEPSVNKLRGDSQRISDEQPIFRAEEKQTTATSLPAAPEISRGMTEPGI